jgi:Flp pilus assembly protein TadG
MFGTARKTRGSASSAQGPHARRRGPARFRKDVRGNVAAIFALALPMLIAGVGFGVETGYWYFRQLNLQQAADAAAFAGGVSDRMGQTSAQILSTATSAAQQNGFNPSGGTITLNTPPASGAYQNSNSVEVILTRNEQRYFTQLFSTSPVTTRARAVATFLTASDACILALDPIADKAAQFSGNSATFLAGCSVMANSLAPDAVNVQGSAQLTAPCVLSAGGVTATSGLTETSCSQPVTNLPPVADPLRNLAEPPDTGPCLSSAGTTLTAGRYCGGLSISGSKSLGPGTYIIDGGTLKINANASVIGASVTFLLANNATVSMNGNATVALSAPTSGALSGILFFGSRSNTSSINSFNGTASSSMTGTIYIPKGEADYLGNFSGTNGCTHVIADLVQWTGDTTIGVNCTAEGMNDIQVAQQVKLVE